MIQSKAFKKENDIYFLINPDLMIDEWNTMNVDDRVIYLKRYLNICTYNSNYCISDYINTSEKLVKIIALDPYDKNMSTWFICNISYGDCAILERELRLTDGSGDYMSDFDYIFENLYDEEDDEEEDD